MQTSHKTALSCFVSITLCFVVSGFGYAENLALSTNPGPPSTTLEIESVDASGTLDTGYGYYSGWASGPYIDLTAGAEAVRIVSFEMYFKGTLNRDVEVYWKVGSYVGSEEDPSAWTLLGTVNVTPGGDGTLTAVNLGGVDIPAGQTYGFSVWDGGETGTGSGDGPGFDLRSGGTVASDANLTLSSNAFTSSARFLGASGGWGWQGTVIYGDVPVELMSFEIE